MLGTILTINAMLLYSVQAWPYLNKTLTIGTALNETYNTLSPPVAVATVPCQVFYPSELRILNSRYANYDATPLHGRNNMIMLLRQRDDTFQIASQIQFNGLTILPNTTCHLLFKLPVSSLQTIAGPNPIFNLYQVEREAGSTAAYDMFEAKNITEKDPPVFGQVNGTEAARKMQWMEHQGVYDIGPARCNETLTFQAGLAFNGGDDVNYWEFINVAPPANPIQGFKIITGDNCWGQHNELKAQ